MSWKNSFVYVLLNPLDCYIPFYVGKGSNQNNRTKFRPRFHLLEALRGKKSSKCDTIREIVAANEMYIVLIWQDNLTLNEAYELETFLIKRFGRKNYDENGILTNILVDNRNGDYSKTVYRKGADHHSYNTKRSIETRTRQRETCKIKAVIEGKYLCKCGCGAEISEDQKNYSQNDRRKNWIAEWHFKHLPHNYAKSRKIKLLVKGFKEKDITEHMYLDKNTFKQVIGDIQ